MRLCTVVSAVAAAALVVLPPAAARLRDAGTPLSTGHVSQWAYPLRSVAARKAPSATAPVVTIVSPATPEGESNLLLALETRFDGRLREWVRVRLAILPNNSTGWVPRTALGELHVVRTRLIVDRRRFTAVLYRGGRAVFRTHIGVGLPYWPTPRGEFYVRERLGGFGDPFYGPVAFGTSARSATLTDWPGGGYVGIHGTNQPELLPGAVSHGCIRMPNDAILRLARLMPLGTPVTIR
jgi:lipoprotein-anchoring transpeptidase ErfK/SrfK